ncbi:hypothetical protein PV379_02115 [Streptomyces caniscabiei]|nr:hypothetical protein [Streptomyces caniscabiei]MDX2776148.1 hypothetical protein [Streptomyces caniscabiei]
MLLDEVMQRVLVGLMVLERLTAERPLDAVGRMGLLAELVATLCLRH